MTLEKSIYSVDTHKDAGASKNEHNDSEMKGNSPISIYTKQLTLAIGLFLGGMGLSSCDKSYEDVQPRKSRSWDLMNKGTILESVDNVDSTDSASDALVVGQPVVKKPRGAI